MNPLSLLVAGAFFMEILDGTIIVTALPAMGRSFGASAVDLHVGITAYLLAVTIFILPGGWAADRFGARRVFTLAIAVFTIGSALCGIAGSTDAFVAARVLQGIGGAMMVPIGRLVVLRTTPKERLMQATALLTWPALTAPLLGPPLGGFFASHLSWRYIFFINVPIGLVAMALALRLVPAVRRPERGPFDWRGFILGTCFLGCLVHTLDLVSDPGSPVLEVIAFAAGIFVFGGLLVWHVRGHTAPLLNFAPMQFATFRNIMISGTAVRALINAVPFLLPLMFQLGFGWSPLEAGSLMLPLFAGNLGIKPATTPLLRRFGFRRLMIVNAVLQAVTMALCARLTPATPIPVIALLLVISGASRSTQYTAIATLAFADVPQRLMNMANTLFSVTFQLSLAVGVAVGAVGLRIASGAVGEAAQPSLTSFHTAFVLLAVLTAATALGPLQLPATAGAVVSGHKPA